MERLDGYLRIKDAAAFLGVSPNTLRNWGRDGKVPEHRHPVNNYRLYKETELSRLLRLAEQRPKSAPVHRSPVAHRPG
ncbi:MerR family DNA-binding transcriptional regulator [Planctomyces sp. SH-PL14]|uniref:MerR family DNA-binding transcriptional regulator n=1 Tax=Planctomyces sp. SH-PL14 TaxID=1632864 RepID=UPI00078B30C3|nr:MerR family DNA-binding transcriptional regulator [Planctomyces sp. SH-PL14]AMV19852.1 MerR family regulatory protein [Planctomyces sp. SH-PL14]